MSLVFIAEFYYENVNAIYSKSQIGLDLNILYVEIYTENKTICALDIKSQRFHLDVCFIRVSTANQKFKTILQNTPSDDFKLIHSQTLVICEGN